MQDTQSLGQLILLDICFVTKAAYVKGSILKYRETFIRNKQYNNQKNAFYPFYADTLNLRGYMLHILCSRMFYTFNKLQLIKIFLFKKIRFTGAKEKHSQNRVLRK